MADESTGGTLTEVKVSEGDYIDGLTVTLKDGTSKDYPFKYENEAALETARIDADAAAKAANEAKAAVEANEEQRKADEKTRDSNEQTRKSEFTKAKQEAEDQAAEAKKAAAAANEAKRLADEATELANAAAGNADEATSSATEAARKANAAAEAVSVATLGISTQQLRAMVRMGNAADVLRIGDQLNSTFTWDGKEYPLPFDVLHHFNGRDADHPLSTLEGGIEAPTMAIGAHFALPPACAFDSREALYVPEADMQPGQYDLVVEVNYVWGTGVCAAKGSTRFTFTTTKVWPAGCQVLWNASYSGKLTTLTAYQNFSDEVIETVSVAAGGGGTLIGTANEQINGRINNIQRACEGSDCYPQSGLHRWANAHGTDWDVQQGIFDRPHPLHRKPGLLDCLPPELVEVLAKVSVKTQLHPVDGGEIAETFDYAYPPSARQHYFSNYLGATTEGYNAEGVPFDYFKALAVGTGLTGPFQGWQTYQALITFAAENHSVACGCWLRSPRRVAAGAGYEGIVGSSGGVGDAGAAYGGRLVVVLHIG